MITRPVAVARGLIVTAAVWLLGAGATVGLFSFFHADTTIDVLGQEDRVQIVWLGAHAFTACVAALLGVGAGGAALARSHVDTPRRAAMLVGATTLLAGAVVTLGLDVTDVTRTETAVALAAGLVIGAVAGGVFVLQSDVSERSPYATPARRTGRAWSSR